jgi:mRNA-degrading endonuclease toxin of MazEF toxin-antitoxin module
MPTECVLSFDNLATVPKSSLTERITRLSVPNLTALCRALKVATGC